MTSNAILKSEFLLLKILKVNKQKEVFDRPSAQLLGAHAIGAGGLGFKSRVGQIGTVSPTSRHRCDVPSELL